MKSARTAPRHASALVVLLAAAGFLAGCGAASAPPVRPPVTTTVTVTALPSATTSPAPSSPAPTGPPSCVTSALAASIGPGSGAAGSTYYPIEFTNTSGATCTLYGYPGVSFITASGGQLGAAATEDPTYPRELVTLTPGAVAHAELRVTDAMNYPSPACQVVTAHRLRVFPPGQTNPLYLTLDARACAITSVQILSVQTVQPGNGATG
jgi:Protein of unknown function (DUF4232)